MFKALLSVFKNVRCCVRLNGVKIEWFPVDCGLKHGCSLSPILFNFFINDLVTRISAMEIGFDIDGENVAILLYADDAVLVCESEKELQVLLQALHTWCMDNKLAVNHNKSKVDHFRPQSVVMYDSYLLKDVHSVLVNFPREYAQESMMLYI